MEQQSDVQSLDESSRDSKSLGDWAQETTELSLNDVSVSYEFRDGAYYCEGLNSGYMSLDTLRRAWALKVREEKMAEARRTVKASKASESSKKKAIKDFQKWRQTEIK